MNKKEMIQILEEAVTVEDIPTLENIQSMRELINSINFDTKTRKKISSRLNHINKDSMRHSRSFNSMLKLVIKSKKNEY